MSAEGKTRKRMGITAIISSIIIVASIVWGLYTFALIQFGEVRQYDPHYEYDDIEYWPYTHDFAGSDGNWFDNLNYSDFNLDQTLPEDLLDFMDDPVFYVTPADPGQLWRIESYDEYDGSSWTKSSTTPPRDLISGVELIPISAATNPVYVILFNATAGAEVGSISLPSIFPSLQVIEDSFETYSVVGDLFVVDDPTRLLHYDLETDDYGTLLFSPLIDGTTGEDVMVSFMVTFVDQDIDLVQSTAQPGVLAPPQIAATYTDLSLVEPLSQLVLDDVHQFDSAGTNAYEKAMAVKVYFQSTFILNLTQEALLDRPSGQEITDWFLERGNGLPMDFATAYCVFMRELGIPARLVSGYVVGEQHPTVDMRTLMVRHMSFWTEVFIPMSGHPQGGEWIQVIPTPLTDELGGDVDPGNTPIPELELLVWPTNGQPWAETGTPFGLSANISVEGVFITTPDTVYFYDETDSDAIGPATIGAYVPAVANLTYTFPGDATVDFHSITASWMNSYFMVTNATRIFAVSTPIPLASEAASIEPTDVVIAETHDLDINQGLSTHVALWEDTVHVYGVMTVGGVPVNGSSIIYNRNIQIMWDDVSMGDAWIEDDGSYALDVYVDPLDLAQMTVGQHEVWSSYAGDWDPIFEFYRLNPADSTFNSTVTVWGTIGFDLSVTPTSTFAGGTITYDGRIYFMNGSLLPAGQSVGTFFHSQANSTRALNATGGFQWAYLIPGAQSDGTYMARANWTSPFPYIAGNWSISIPIDVGAGGSQIALILLPDPVFIGETYTIWGYLQHVSNSSGIGSQWVDVYWSNGTTTYVGSSLTAADGYFEVTYLIPAGYEGPVTYWANFTSLIPALTDAESAHIPTTVKRYDVDITITDDPDPIHLLQTVTIQGIVSMPENGSYPLISETVELWWSNTTYTGIIDTTVTNSTGGYAFYYQIPLSHSNEMVTVWVHFTSPYTNIADGESIHETLLIEATNTLLSVYSDFASYYLNETVQITGNLQFANGTPLVFERVFIHWINASGTYVFEKFTDISGDYQFQYNLSANMDAGIVNVHVNWTSWSGLYADAFADLAPPIQLNRYDYTLTMTVPTLIFVDETFLIQGILTTSGGTPIVGETLYILYYNGTGWAPLASQVTNSTGGIQLGPIDDGTLLEVSIDFAAVYYSSDPMVNDIIEYFTVSSTQYIVNLEITVLPNPVMQNGTVTIHAYLYFAHNLTPISNADVSIYWNNGSLFWLGNITTDGTGQGDLFYSGMAYDTVRVGIDVYGDFAGTMLLGNNESVHTLLTLEQWQSDLVGLFTPVTVYSLLDTLTVTGALWYVTPSIPYSSVTVELLLEGTPIDSTTTASDGSFLLSWGIPSDTIIGFYDLEVRYVSPAPWILGSQELVANIEITAIGYLFPSFTVSPENPTPVIVLDYLTISGIVTWDNGTPYAFSTVELWWGDPLGTNFWMTDAMTDGVGAFTTNYQVPGVTALGIRQVWAYIPPAGNITFGMSTTRDILIQTHSLTITASVDVTLAHLGDTITISGTAHFANGTPLTGYSIEIWWHSTLWSTEIIDGTGSFSYGIDIPYNEVVGVHSGNVFFSAPSAAFSDTSVNYQDVETREYIYLFMDTQPSPNTFSRGGTVTITGWVTNDDGVPLPVEIRALVDGGTTTSTDDTDPGTGAFSILWNVPTGQSSGPIAITIDSISPFRDVVSLTGSWSIIIVIDTVVGVQVTTSSLLPGESFTVQLSLYDSDGIPINGMSIEIRLGSTVIGTVTLTSGSGTPVDVTIPASWSSDGDFTVTASFTGASYLNGDSDVSANPIHVFTDVVFNNRSRSRVDPGQAFTIEFLLTDSEQNPIVNRDVTLNLNGTNIVQLTTDSEGIVSYDQPGYGEGSLRYSVTLTSDDVSDIASDIYVINFQTQGGIILQGTDLVIAGILLVGAVIAVLAYLYIVKGMFRSVVISRGIDIPTKLRNIKKLADAGKYGASITLAYRTFEQMCGSKMGSERTHSETAREYLDRVLQSIPLDGPTIEQFVQTYEEARFSHHEMTRDRYEAALRIFTDLYPRIDSSAPME